MSDLDWTADGPRSTRFGDIYFSPEDGLAESRAVFLRGCGLPERWRGRRRFTVGELGFGTGLNVLALLDLWRRKRPPGATLHVFSVEAFPLSAQDARRALAAWPELASLAERLLTRWPRGGGFHRIDWPELGATLDLAHGDALDALIRWRGRADAWFLDGFAPARNPAMWSAELLRQVAERSAPGAVAATFTVAGAVRRGLAEAGFTVERRAGFGRKRERLEARLPGLAKDADTPSVAILGGGVAGASLARAFRGLGAAPTIVAPADPGASGNPAALVSPRFDAGAAAPARLMLQAFRRAVALYTDVPEAVIARGLLQLEIQPRDARRFDALAAGALFATGEAERLSAAGASDRLREGPTAGGLWIPEALSVDPQAISRIWLGDGARVEASAAAVERLAGGWAVLDADGRTLAQTEIVVLASGWALAALRPQLPLSPVRGQASWTDAAALDAAVAWGGYAVRTRGGLLFGATHDQGRTDTEADPADDARNLATLAATLPRLADRLAQARLQGRAAVRVTTPDRLPLAGQLEAGLHVLGGLGSRGFTTAPLLAEHVAAEALGAPSPLPADFARIVAPDRPS